MDQGLNPWGTCLHQLYSHSCTPLRVHSALVCGGFRRNWVCFFMKSPKFECVCTFFQHWKKKYFGKLYLDMALINLIWWKVSLPTAEELELGIFKIPSIPYHSMVL